LLQRSQTIYIDRLRPILEGIINWIFRGMILCALAAGAALAQPPPAPDSAGIRLQPSPPPYAGATSADDPVRTKLSTLWTVVALDMIGADILGSYIPGAQEELEDFAGNLAGLTYAYRF
jgi:hypothetical protein